MTTNPATLLTSLRCDPYSAFSAWLTTQTFSEGSTKVYSSMFSRFARWLQAQGIGLDECDETTLDAFLDENKLEKEHRYRYVRLIERVYHHLIHVMKLPLDNPGSRAARAGVGRGENDPMNFLAEPEYRAIAEYLTRPGGGKEEKKEKKEKSSRHWSSFSEWREARDKALASVTLFGALRVGEAAALSVNCITLSGDRLIVYPLGEISHHEAEFLKDGRACLDAWLACRRENQLPGSVMFPSNDLGEPMHPASIYRRVHRVILAAYAEAGLDAEASRLSPQTLRNTYAGILISRGYSVKSIMEYMGIKSEESVYRIEAFFAARAKANLVTAPAAQP